MWLQMYCLISKLKYERSIIVVSFCSKHYTNAKKSTTSQAKGGVTKVFDRTSEVKTEREILLLSLFCYASLYRFFSFKSHWIHQRALWRFASKSSVALANSVFEKTFINSTTFFFPDCRKAAQVKFALQAQVKINIFFVFVFEQRFQLDIYDCCRLDITRLRSIRRRRATLSRSPTNVNTKRALNSYD